jgi:hypothetical protein
MKQGMGLEQVRKVLWHNTDNLESKFIPCLLVVVLCVCVCVCVCVVCVCVYVHVYMCVYVHTQENDLALELCEFDSAFLFIDHVDLSWPLSLA